MAIYASVSKLTYDDTSSIVTSGGLQSTSKLTGAQVTAEVRSGKYYPIRWIASAKSGAGDSTISGNEFPTVYGYLT